MGPPCEKEIWQKLVFKLLQKTELLGLDSPRDAEQNPHVLTQEEQAANPLSSLLLSLPGSSQGPWKLGSITD